MIWQGKLHNRWHLSFAIFPVEVGGSNDKPVWCWLDWYEWRWKNQRDHFSYFERRLIGSTDMFQASQQEYG